MLPFTVIKTQAWLRQFRISELSSEVKVLDLPLTSLVYAESGTVFVSGVGLRSNPRSVSWFVLLGEGRPFRAALKHLRITAIPPFLGRGCAGITTMEDWCY